MTRVTNLVAIMCSAIIKPSALIIQALESHLSPVIQTQWCPPTTRMKRGLQEERRPPSTGYASMKNVHLVGTLQGLGERKKKRCCWSRERWQGNTGCPCRWPVQNKKEEAFFPKKQAAKFLLTPAVKLTVVPVKTITVRSNARIWSAAARATMHGRSA